MSYKQIHFRYLFYLKEKHLTEKVVNINDFYFRYKFSVCNTTENISVLAGTA